MRSQPSKAGKYTKLSRIVQFIDDALLAPITTVVPNKNIITKFNHQKTENRKREEKCSFGNL
jgi:hypothetical protein